MARYRNNNLLPASQELETLLNIHEVMKRLGIQSRQTIYHLMEREGLPHVHVGGKLRFIPTRVRDWVVSKEA
jgi:predicted DNA-binding transcriptional regulator AlpA